MANVFEYSSIISHLRTANLDIDSIWLIWCFGSESPPSNLSFSLCLLVCLRASKDLVWGSWYVYNLHVLHILLSPFWVYFHPSFIAFTIIFVHFASLVESRTSLAYIPHSRVVLGVFELLVLRKRENNTESHTSTNILDHQ